MALSLTLTYGATTVNLNSAAAHCELPINLYVPSAAPLGQDYVTEHFEVIISDTTAANIGADIQAIEKALFQAKFYQQTGMGDRVYANFQPDTYPAAFRSEIIYGELRLDPTAVTFIQANKHCNAVITWTRRNYWEGAETAIPLTNDNGTANTAGLKIYGGTNDRSGVSPTKRCNWADIAAASITGDLPAPARTRLDAVAGGTPGRLALFLNAFSTPASFSHWFESSGSSIADTADASRSGGGYSLLSVAAGATGEIEWAISSGAQRFAGGYYRFLLSIDQASGAAAGYKLRAYFDDFNGKRYYGPRAVWQPTGAGNYYLVDLGAMRLPPAYLAGETYQPIAIGVELTNPSGGASTFRVDSLMTAPLDGVLTTASALYSVGYSDLNGIDQVYWGKEAAGGLINSLIIGVNDHLLLRPGLDQRVYLRMGDLVTPDDPTWAFNIRMWYRPRRLTL